MLRFASGTAAITGAVSLLLLWLLLVGDGRHTKRARVFHQTSVRLLLATRRLALVVTNDFAVGRCRLVHALRVISALQVAPQALVLGGNLKLPEELKPNAMCQ